MASFSISSNTPPTPPLFTRSLTLVLLAPFPPLLTFQFTVAGTAAIRGHPHRIPAVLGLASRIPAVLDLPPRHHLEIAANCRLVVACLLVRKLERSVKREGPAENDDPNGHLQK